MDIVSKVFSVEKRGYNVAEVDNYLKAIAAEIEKQQQLMEKLSAQNEELLARNEEYKSNETAIKDVLMAAHKTAGNMIADAKEEVALLEAQAKLEYSRLYSEVEALKEGFAAYQQRLLGYVENQKEWICGFSDTAPSKVMSEDENESANEAI